MKLSSAVTTSVAAGASGILILLSQFLADPEIRSKIIAVVPAEYHPLIALLVGVVPAIATHIAAHRNPDGGPVSAPYRKETGQTYTRSRADRHANLICFAWEEAIVLASARPDSPFAKFMPMLLEGDPFNTQNGPMLHTALVVGNPLDVSVAFLDSWISAWHAYNGIYCQIGDEWNGLNMVGKLMLLKSVYEKLGKDFIPLIDHEIEKYSQGR